VKRLSRDRSRWIFGICEAAFWVAVEINWERASIRYYDPKDQKPFTLRSEHLAQRVEAWVNHLCHANDDYTRVWKLEQLQGPRQKASDENNCGVYVFWVLHASVQGICVNEESTLDPDRKYYISSDVLLATQHKRKLTTQEATWTVR
jgi:hypothetical protein